jgi:hypothetical protein
MFRFNQKKANSEVDEVKRLLAITKGMRRPNNSISSSFLREDVNMGANPNQPMDGSTAPPIDMQTPGETAETDDIKEIQAAIETSEISEINSDKVKGTALKGKIEFNFDRTELSPSIDINDDIELTSDVEKIMDQIKAYFDIWKKKPK